MSCPLHYIELLREDEWEMLCSSEKKQVKNKMGIQHEHSHIHTLNHSYKDEEMNQEKEIVREVNHMIRGENSLLSFNFTKHLDLMDIQ